MVTLNAKQHDGLAGALTRDRDAVMPGATYPSPLQGRCRDVTDNMVVSVAFAEPAMPPGFQFQARLLPTVRMPKPVRSARLTFRTPKSRPIPANQRLRAPSLV